MSQLTIYKASAGSGKTYRITGEYLKLLFQNPDNYRHILGVTFTNKATAEMKSRIIKELYKLSQGENSGYTHELSKNTELKASEIKTMATYILNRILHDYSHFSISTIDSFFQRVLRSFAREIGLLQGFEIELDQKKILLAAIDQLLFSIDEHPELKDWLVQFAENKIMVGQSWNFTSDIESLGGELFKENFKELADKLYEKITDKKFLDTFLKDLNKAKELVDQKLKEAFARATRIIRENGLSTDDFKGKSRGFGAYVAKWANARSFDEWKISDTLRNSLDEPAEWVNTKSANCKIVEEAFHNGLNQILKELIEIESDDFVLYKSIVTVQKNFYVLGMIADLQKEVREYSADKNLFLISDTSELLFKLIDGSDAPFIFERTGTYINHFMIDEFQDTSVLQWKNFKPLVINSLAEDNQNWVVGDVKQSIYRWRNSDWTILSDKITGEIAPHHSSVETLNYNWRSKINVVKFNNTFFRNAIDQLLLLEITPSSEPAENQFAKVLTSAYSDFEQLVPDGSKPEAGMVQVELISTESKRGNEWKEEVLLRLPGFIENLQDSGYQLSDIALLVRDKSEARMVSDFFLGYAKQNARNNYRYDIISGDSLLLKNSTIVKWLIACFTYISEPDDMINSAFLLYHYLITVKGNEAKKTEELFKPGGESCFPNELTDFFTNPVLKQLSIFELTDHLIIYFELQKLTSELPFLLAFQDLIQNYTKREAADIHSFLQWWIEFQDKQVISMPDNQKAMRLMTFHSSKGLEFSVVIIPFGDWEIIKTSRNNNFLWCRPSVSPLNALDLIPVNMSANLEKTVFKDDYLHEKGLLFVDNLNLLYVAFTRAIDVLCIYTPEYKEAELKNNISSLIINSLKNQYLEIETSKFPAAYLPEYFTTDAQQFKLGNLAVQISEKADNKDYQLNTMLYPVRSLSDVARQVISSSEYLVNSGENLSSHLSMGSILHEIFQNIIYLDDVDRAILKVYSDGKIMASDKAKLLDFINGALSAEEVRPWFEPEWEIKTEASIMLPDKTVYRPDRVMIKGAKTIVVDYKFGGDQSDSYNAQVTKYMHFLKLMGYSQIEGFLWYVSLRKIIKVNQELVQGRLFN